MLSYNVDFVASHWLHILNMYVAESCRIEALFLRLKRNTSSRLLAFYLDIPHTRTFTLKYYSILGRT
jgi:hypothetical protein